jgi:hypothetical protein
MELLKNIPFFSMFNTIRLSIGLKIYAFKTMGLLYLVILFFLKIS